MTTIATWNVNSIRARIEHLTSWLNQASPEVVGIQETKVQDTDFPHAELAALGYHVLFSGQKSYNGMALLSKQPATLIATELPGFDDAQRRVLAANVAGITLLNLYVPNGSAVGSEKYSYKLAWLDALGDWVANLLASGDPLMLVGDFNIAPDDRDVHDPAAWEGKILCSEDERRRLQRLVDLGLCDVFRRFEQAPQSFSWWDYRSGGFRRNQGLRIDLILASPALAERCEKCEIDLEPRRWEKPSDHAPVVVHLRP
jgi:exodeoxyribonuclease III